jgi:hypothetical protein
MNGNRAKRGNLAWLLLVGTLATGCEEWWGEEEDEDASVEPSTDGSVDSGPAPIDAGSDAGPAPDSAVPVDAAPDAPPDAAPVLDGATDAAVDAGQADAAPDAAPDAAIDAGPPDAAPGTELPCDVAKVLKDRCQSCHGNPPTQAPMALVTLADLKATSAMGGFIYERVQVRIDSTTMPMPPTWGSTGALTASEKATLTSWISAGALGSNNTCR